MKTDKQLSFESLSLSRRRRGKKVHIILDEAFPLQTWCGRRINRSISDPTEAIYLTSKISDLDPYIYCVTCIRLCRAQAESQE